MDLGRLGGVVLLALSVGLSTPSAETATTKAQAFSSGSTGADGALDLANICTSPYPVGDPNSCYVQLPPNGILNYTTVNIPSNKVLKFRKNLQNTPVVLLAQGNVTVAGAIQIQGGDFPLNSPNSIDYSLPGPGGFRGGSSGQPGFGPAGGLASGSGTLRHAKWAGPLSLVPIIGGSGGGGSGPSCCTASDVGGGGGGAIVVASSSSISVLGSIYANGTGVSSNGYGSGGAIRLVANSIAVIAPGVLLANGGIGQPAYQGMIRLEAPLGAVNLTGFTQPAAIIAPINPAIVASATASLTIVSVGGFVVPAYSGQRTDTVDLILPMQLPEPINVLVAASNIPVGTPVQLQFGTTNAGSVTPGVLAGSTSSSSATVTVSGLNRTQLAYLFVSATFSVAQGAAAGNPEGPNQVAQIKASSPPGGATQFAFLRKDGSRINERDVPPQVLKPFRQ